MATEALTNDARTLAKLRTYLNNKPCSCCFDLRPLADARIVNEREMSGYTAELWTLNEHRWTTEAKSVYYGDEKLSEQPLGNIWQDYQIERPSKTLLDKIEVKEVVKDLKETQRRERCSKCECIGETKCTTCEGIGRQPCDKCNQKGTIDCCQDESCSKCEGEGVYRCVQCSGNGKLDCSTCKTRGRMLCPDCKGLRFVIVWFQLHVKWENHHSSITRDLGNSTVLPAEEIERSSGKVTCFDFDDVCSSSQPSINHMFDSCPDIPADIRSKIQEKYRIGHDDKDERPIRLRCLIQRLHMKEIDYAFDKDANKVYTYCVYGEDENHIYDNRYPYKCCGLSSCTIL